MPRKTEGMEYKLLPGPNKGDDGQPQLHVRPASNRKYSMKAIDEWATKYRGFHSGELTRALECFIDVATVLMSDGSRVETPLGSFAPKLRLQGNHTNPDEVKDDDVALHSVDFNPSHYFKGRLSDRIYAGFRRWRDVIEHHPVETPEQIEEALRKSVSSGYITIKLFAFHAGLQYDTARRLLDKLCEGEKPLLRKRREGRTNHFFPISKK